MGPKRRGPGHYRQTPRTCPLDPTWPDVSGLEQQGKMRPERRPSRETLVPPQSSSSRCPCSLLACVVVLPSMQGAGADTCQDQIARWAYRDYAKRNHAVLRVFV